jgi:hypothetical protein
VLSEANDTPKGEISTFETGAGCGRTNSIPPSVCLEIDCRRDTENAARAPESKGPDGQAQPIESLVVSEFQRFSGYGEKFPP